MIFEHSLAVTLWPKSPSKTYNMQTKKDYVSKSQHKCDNNCRFSQDSIVQLSWSCRRNTRWSRQMAVMILQGIYTNVQSSSLVINICKYLTLNKANYHQIIEHSSLNLFWRSVFIIFKDEKYLSTDVAATNNINASLMRR